jgi:hypothetical protein
MIVGNSCCGNIVRQFAPVGYSQNIVREVDMLR